VAGARRDWRLTDSLVAAGLLGAATALMLAARVHLNVLSVALVFLILVVAIALFADSLTSVTAAVVAFLLFDVFFILPYYTLTVAASDHVFVLVVFLGVASVTSQLVYRVRVRTYEALNRGRQMETLNALSHALLSDVTLEEMLRTICERLTNVLQTGSCAILMPDASGVLAVREARGPQPDPDDRDHRAVAEWVFENREPAGLGLPRGKLAIFRGSATRPSASTGAATLYVPIATVSRVIGVARIGHPSEGRSFSDDQQLLLTFANHAALALERARLTEEATQVAVLARSDTLKSALLSAVSHDLRTPLASIKASVTSLLQDDITWSAADERDLLTAINEETDRLTRIVSNLLDLTRIEAGVLKPQLEWNDVGELLADVASRVRVALGAHDLTVEVAGNLPPLRFDYVELAQVLVNLLENAARYSPEGTPIELAASAVGETIEISVADRGIGIPPGEEERIFDKFYRISERPNAAGAGIGLSISQGIIHAHGGQIRVERRPGGGTVFVCVLPVEPVTTNDAEIVAGKGTQWARRS
jgi:two-component system, OmpR family, sensor histidine kinase KdpD